MGIGKRILSVLIGILFIISVSVLGGSLLAKQVLVKAISQAGIDTAISHRMMDAVFGYAGADDTQWIAKIQNKIEKNEEVQKITEKVMDEMVNDLSKGTGYKDVDMLKLMKQQLKDEMDDVQDVLNSYASNLYGNMKDTSTIQGKVARLYTTLVSTTCRAVSGAAVLLCAILTVLLGYPRHRGLFSLGVESLICGGIFAGLIGVMGSRTMGFLSDKMLGRTVDIGLKSYFWMGCIFAGKCNRVNEQDVNVTGMRKVIFYILYLLEP